MYCSNDYVLTIVLSVLHVRTYICAHVTMYVCTYVCVQNDMTHISLIKQSENQETNREKYNLGRDKYNWI